MADRWYFAWGESTFGPYSAVHLRQIAALGRLLPIDAVWEEGTALRLPPDQVKQLFPDLQAPTLPAHAHAPVANPASAPPQLPEGIRPSIPGEAVTLEAPSAASTAPETPAGRQEEARKPDGMMLRVVADENDSALAAAPPSSDRPGPATTQDRTREASPAVTGAGGQNPQRPAPTSPNHSSPQNQPVRKGRATAVRGVVIVSQDGDRVHYRNKCVKCGHEDACRSTMPIRSGVTRGQFFCPRCRELGETVIKGVC